MHRRRFLRSIATAALLAAVAGTLPQAAPAAVTAVTGVAGLSRLPVYTIVKGDTLWLIGNRYGLSVAELKQVNSLSSDEIRLGQILRLGGSYTVAKGDILWQIAEKLQVSLTTLMQLNGIGQSGVIYPGQVLYYPARKGSASTPVTAPVRPAAPFAHPLMNAAYQFPLATGAAYLPLTPDYGDGRSWTPDGQQARVHSGQDLFAAKGTPVYAVAAGTVDRLGWNDYGGWRITYRVTGTDYRFYYAHLSGYGPGLTLGGTVKAGQLLGYVGSTGYGPVGTNGLFDPHLHFGIYTTSGSTIDPYPFLKYWEGNKP